MRHDVADYTVISGLVLLTAFGVPRVAAAADVVLLASNGIRPVLEEALPPFERSTSHKVVVRYDVAAELRRQVAAPPARAPSRPERLPGLARALCRAGAGRHSTRPRNQRFTVRSMKSTSSRDTLVSDVPSDQSCDE